MKKELVIMSLIFSTTVFAQSNSDFKEGYNAGRSSVLANTIHSCEVTYETIRFNRKELVKENGEGLSRGLALMNLVGKCSGIGEYSGRSECLAEVRAGSVHCKEI